MKKFFTILAIFGMCAIPQMRAQGFPDDPGTLMLDVVLSAETSDGDTLQMTFTGAGSYASGTEVTIVAPTRPGLQFQQWSDQNTDATRTFTLTESITLTAIYEVLEYEIKFIDADGTLLLQRTETYGTLPDTTEMNPFHEYTDQYTFNFVRWTPTVVPVTESQIYYAVYDTITNKYSIRFMDGDSVLQMDTLEYGATPQFRGNNPTKDPENGMQYTFIGWEPEITTVTGEADYEAQFEESMIQIHVVTIVMNDTTSETVDWGTEYMFEATEKEGYTFSGWSNGSVEQTMYITLTQDTVMTALYERNYYEIRFINNYGDSTQVLEVDTVEHGVIPQYGGETPTRPTEDGTVYTFIGWEPEIAAATEDATYSANFTDEMIQIHVVTIIRNDTSSQTVDWGTELTFEASEVEGYTFSGWSNGVVENPLHITVTKDTVLTAIYERNYYEIIFFDYDGTTILERDTVEHGVVPQYGGTTPTRETAEGHKYTFTGWNPDIVAATENATYTAVYSDSLLQFTVLFIMNKDTMPATVAWGTEHTMDAADIEGMHFVRWSDGETDNPRNAVITSDTVFIAIYSESYLNIPMAANDWTFICLPMFNMSDYSYTSSLFTFVPNEGGNAPQLSWGAYNGATRASAASGWENYEETEFNAGKGYIVSSPVAGTLKIEAYAENLQTEQATLALQQYAATHEQNANWNFIGNPLNRSLSANEISVDGINDASITIWNGTGYMNELIGQDGTATIDPLQAFFFQTTAQGTAMTFAQQGNPAPSRVMPSENSRIDIEATAGGYTDRTRVIFRANSSLRYEAGRDASKFLTSSAPVQLYFIDVDNVQCAQMVRPTGNDIMHLGFMMHQAGEMTINMPVFAGDYELYDALTNRSYDLNEQITIYSERGTFNNRLELRPVERAYTSVDNTTVQNFVVTNRGIYVLGNAPVSVYSIVGQLITTQQAQGLILLGNGSYIVVSGEQAEKVVLQ